jgi:hypothetical protein
MNSLEQLRLEQELRGSTRRAQAKPSRDAWTQSELNQAWRTITAPTLAMMQVFANLPDSLEAVVACQNVLPRDAGEFRALSPDDFLVFCRQLRTVWGAFDLATIEQKKLVRGEAETILHEWWGKYPLVNGGYWNIFWQTGTFFPGRMNWGALIARVCFDNRGRLGVCKACKGYFVKPRASSSYCSGTDCRKYENRQRQARHQQQKRKSARKTKRTQ